MSRVRIKWGTTQYHKLQQQKKFSLGVLQVLSVVLNDSFTCTKYVFGPSAAPEWSCGEENKADISAHLLIYYPAITLQAVFVLNATVAGWAFGLSCPSHSVTKGKQIQEILMSIREKKSPREGEFMHQNWEFWLFAFNVDVSKEWSIP